MTKPKPKRTRKAKEEPGMGELIVGFATAIDVAFERLTGKPVAAWLEEFRHRPQELPPGDEMASSNTMSLADAYAVLGVTSDAPAEQIRTHYRNLAKLFHSDKGAMNDEAMKLLNRAHDRITKGGK